MNGGETEQNILGQKESDSSKGTVEYKKSSFP